ncbi:hypothetical protein GQ457_09G008840 [Hibiscus cannabinus]
MNTGVLNSWIKPPQGWCKLNTDVVVSRSSSMATCGGVVLLEAEPWGLYEGLLAAWSIGVRSLLIESDNLEVVNLLNNHTGLSCVLSIVHYIVDILIRSWVTKVVHVGQGGNSLADGMAKLSNFDVYLCHRFLNPPAAVESLILHDTSD